MKIVLASNYYKRDNEFNKRQKLSIQSFLKIKEKFPENVELVNLAFEDEQVDIEGFKTYNQLQRSSKEIIKDYFVNFIRECDENLTKRIEECKTKLPSVYEIFTILSQLDCDYFLFVNDDIVVSDRYIKEILNSTDDALIASRLHVFELNDLSNNFKPESYSVHGFDGFAVRSKFWQENKYNFPEFLLGRPYWDTNYYTRFKLLGNVKTLNKLPPVIFHEDHASTSCTTEDIETFYNNDIFKRDLICPRVWFNYCNNVLMKRQTSNNIKWLIPFQNEEELETKAFKGIFVNENVKSIQAQESTHLLLCDNKVDVILPCAPKDYIKLKFSLQSIVDYVENLNKIFVVTPNKINEVKDVNLKGKKVQYLLDFDVLKDCDPKRFRFRPNWCVQQFIKLFQDITETDYYYTFDVDGVLNRKIQMFDGGNPIWYVGWPQNHFPYFMFNKYMLNLEKCANHTFIGDMCFFNKEIIGDMLDRYSLTKKQFLERSYELITASCHISESEMYGNYCTKYFPNLYKFRKIKQFHFGKYQNDAMQVNWSMEEIEKLIKEQHGKDYDIVQMHSWCADSKDYWQK